MKIARPLRWSTPGGWSSVSEREGPCGAGFPGRHAGQLIAYPQSPHPADTAAAGTTRRPAGAGGGHLADQVRIAAGLFELVAVGGLRGHQRSTMLKVRVDHTEDLGPHHCRLPPHLG